MPLYHKTGLLLLVTIFWLLWCSPSFAQTDALSEEEYRQEARTYMVTPCLEEVGQIMIKGMDIEEPLVTGFEFFRVVASDEYERIENELIGVALEKAKDKPKNERMFWYKVSISFCVKAWEKRMRDRDLLPEMTQSTQKSLDPKDEPDEVIKEQQSNSDARVSAQAKRNAVQTCKNSLQILGDIPWFILNACIQQELQAYQEFQRNYGD